MKRDLRQSEGLLSLVKPGNHGSYAVAACSGMVVDGARKMRGQKDEFRSGERVLRNNISQSQSAPQEWLMRVASADAAEGVYDT